MPAFTAALRGRLRKVLGFAAATGAATGLAVAGFEWLTRRQLFDRILDTPLAVQVVAPLGGLLLAALAMRFLAGGASSATADEYIRNFQDAGTSLDLRPVPGRVAASVATLGLGGAMGYEAPAIYLGRRSAPPSSAGSVGTSPVRTPSACWCAGRPPASPPSSGADGCSSRLAWRRR